MAKKILVVDDEYQNRLILTDLLTHEGFLIQTAENGKVAIEVLKREKDIDLVLTDLNMPEMNGMELAHEIRTYFPHIPAVMITGDPDDAKRAEVFQVLEKPLNFDEVIYFAKLLTGLPMS